MKKIKKKEERRGGKNSIATLKRSSDGRKDLAIAKTLDKRTGSLSLKPYTFSSSLSLKIDTEVSNLATLAWRQPMVIYIMQ